MKTKLICFICCIVLFVGICPTFSFAETYTTNELDEEAINKSLAVNSLGDFKILMEEEQYEDISLSAKNEILSNVDVEIVNEYQDEKINMAADIINSKSVDFSNVTVEQNGDTYATANVDLGDGATLTITYSDIEEPNLIDLIGAEIIPLLIDSAYADTTDSIKAIDMYQYYEGYKDYGNRYYTATYKLTYLIGYMTIITENHYNISDAGLTERFGVTEHDYWGYFENVQDSWKITDSTASSVGYDINILGTVTYDRTNEVLPNHGPVYLQQDTRVKLLALDKTNHRAKISQYAYILRSFPTL